MDKKEPHFYMRIISIVLAVAVGTGAYAVYQTTQSHKYKRYLDYTYQRAFSEIVDSVNNMDTVLEKSVYAGSTEQLVKLSNDLSIEASNAKANLGQLPLADARLDKMSKFLNQVGDYATVLSYKVINSEKVTDKEKDNLNTLSQYGATLAQQVTDVATDVREGRLKIGEIGQAVQSESEKEQDDDTPQILSLSLQNIEQEFSEYPELIYDGPYSEHVQKTKPKMLEGKSEVTKEKAKDFAAKFLGLKSSQLKDTGDGNGTIKTYSFADGDKSIEVSKVGGLPFCMVDSRSVGKASIKIDKAMKTAQEYLQAHGFTNMKQSYYAIANNIATINFAYEKDNITFYTDLIKVGVALDNGSIVSLETSGYLMNHGTRQTTPVIVTKDEAKKSVSNLLTIKSHRMTVIPTVFKTEVLCHEFTCESKEGRTLLVYINAANGREQQILILLQSDGGVLTK